MQDLEELRKEILSGGQLFSPNLAIELINRLQASEKECVDHKKDAEMLAKRLEESANHVHAIEPELKALREQKPVAYADPQAFINFDNATQNKEWMWCSPDAGLVAVYAAPVAQSRDSAEPVADAMETFSGWLESPEGIQARSTDILHLDSYKDVYMARLEAAFIAGKNSAHPLATVEAKQAVPDGWREIIEAVAHVGIDFGFGAYQLTDDHIANARILLAAAPQPETDKKTAEEIIEILDFESQDRDLWAEDSESNSQPEGAAPEPYGWFSEREDFTRNEQTVKQWPGHNWIPLYDHSQQSPAPKAHGELIENLKSEASAFVDEYHFAGDGGYYAPNDFEHVMLKDCLISFLDGVE